MKKKIQIVLLALLLLLGIKAAARAQTLSGYISGHINYFLLDSLQGGTRGTCVALDSGSPVMCLRLTNPLYRELTGLLTSAYATGKYCNIRIYATGGAVQNEIIVAYCT